MKDKVFRKDHVDTSNFMEGNLRQSVNKNFCLTSLKAGLVCESSRILKPIEQSMPGDRLVPVKGFGRVLRTDRCVSRLSDGLCFLTTSEERNLGILTNGASSVLRNNPDIGIY